MNCLDFIVFLFCTLEQQIKQNLTLSLSDKLCQLLLVMPNYDSNV